MTPAKFRRLRERLKLTQAALARELGVTRNTVTRWEIGLHPVPPIAARLVRQLARAA